METQEKQFVPIIDKLKSLQTVTASKAYRSRVEKLLVPSLPSHARIIFPLFTRLALIGLLLTLLGGSAVVFAAEKSKQGDFLYPVKQFTDSIKTKFSLLSPSVVITPTPSPVLPTPTSNQMQDAIDLPVTVNQTLPKLKNTTSQIQPTIHVTLKLVTGEVLSPTSAWVLLPTQTDILPVLPTDVPTVIPTQSSGINISISAPNITVKMGL